jgi:exodeoxyribonuclease V alpha subunit
MSAEALAAAPDVTAARLGPLRQAVAAGELRALDLQLARWLDEIAPGASPACLLAAALASHRVGQGDVCLDLATVAGLAPFPGIPGLQAPGLPDWRAELLRWAMVGRPDGERAPLVLDGSDRLYLARYWHYERQLASAVGGRSGAWVGDLDAPRLAAGLSRLFRSPPGSEPDWQRVAAALAVLKPFCVISGGPGTGKTRTVTAILALIADQAGQGRPPRIALAAPTGKAAARLTESVRRSKSDFLASGALDPALAALIPEDASTLHRLLGARPGRVIPRHHRGNPLHLDLLVVDEASMLDLPLAARVVDALPPGCRLILLGDRDQLASVQAGAVLGDICGRGRASRYSARLIERLTVVGALERSDTLGLGGSPADPAQLDLPLEPVGDASGIGSGAPSGRGRGEADQTGLGDCVALLRKSWRFKVGSGIHALATAIHRGDGHGALAVLESGQPDAVRIDVPPRLIAREAEAVLARFVEGFVVSGHRAVLERTDPADALDALGGYRLLCAVREGPFGLANLNRLAERALAAAGLIRPEDERYPGRPMLVTANDLDLGLYNGDVGLLLPDPDAGGDLYAWFQTAEGLRRFSPHRLPPVETLFAMTVHKSQGSEFERVALVLPRHDSRAVTRELIYTGVTRARAEVTLVTPAERLIEGVNRRVQRSSGLYDAFWSVPGPGPQG